MDAILQGWRNVLFSIVAGPLSAAEQDTLAKVQCSWVLLNTRLGRFYVDIIGPVERLQNIQDKLTELGRDPIVIGIFKPVDVVRMVDVLDDQGTVVGQQQVTDLALELQPGSKNAAEYLKVARDVKTYNADGTLASSTRPTAFIDIHRWAGWPAKTL